MTTEGKIVAWFSYKIAISVWKIHNICSLRREGEAFIWPLYLTGLMGGLLQWQLSFSPQRKAGALDNRETFGQQVTFLTWLTGTLKAEDFFFLNLDFTFQRSTDNSFDFKLVVCPLTCTVNSGVLHRQVCGFEKHV